MATTFNMGETVIVNYTSVKAGVAYDPATSVNIVIYKPDGTVDTTSTAMTKTATGVYNYPWQTSGKTIGKYNAVVTATDGAYITITEDTIQLTS